MPSKEPAHWDRTREHRLSEDEEIKIREEVRTLLHLDRANEGNGAVDVVQHPGILCGIGNLRFTSAENMKAVAKLVAASQAHACGRALSLDSFRSGVGGQLAMRIRCSCRGEPEPNADRKRWQKVSIKCGCNFSMLLYGSGQITVHPHAVGHQHHPDCKFFTAEEIARRAKTAEQVMSPRAKESIAKATAGARRDDGTLSRRQHSMGTA